MANNHDDESRLSRLILAYDEALRRGDSYDGSEEDDLSPELRSELASVKQCLRLLRQPTSEASADTRTGQDDVTPLTGSPLARGAGWRPTHIGRFTICRELGSGGGGIVFLADDPQLGRQVALKIPPLEFLSLPQLRLRFARDAKAAALLHHPNIVTVHEVGETGLISYIASEYCEGGSLADWLAARTDPVPIGEAVEIVLAITQAVQHAHGRGVLHRDIKPGNVLRACSEGATEDQRWVPKLADFGLARILDSEDERTRTGTVLGTSAYMSPEQALGKVNEIDVRSDVYALGALLYELLAGQPPLKGATDVETIHRVVYEEVPPLRRRRPDVPRDLEAICLKCLAKAPQARYATAEALADDLRRFVQREPTVARPLSAPQRLLRWVQRRPAWATATVLCVVALSMAAALLLNDIKHRLELARVDAESKERQTQQLRSTRRLNYALEMKQALELWNGANDEFVADGLKETLDRYMPRPGEDDLRTFPWYFLYGQRFAKQQEPVQRSGDIYAVRLSPDGQSIAFGGLDSQVCLLDARTGALQDFPRVHGSEVKDLAFSPDGRLLASASMDQTVGIWEVGSRTLRHRIPPEALGKAVVMGVDISPDGKLLAAGGEDGFARLFDTSDWSLASELPFPPRVQEVRFSPTGELLAIAGKYDVFIWDVTAQALRHTIDTHREPNASPGSTRVGGIAWSPDGRTLVTVGLKDNRIVLWDTSNWNEVGTLNAGRNWLHGAVVSPDSRYLAVAGKDQIVWLWDLTDRRLVATLLGHDACIWNLAFSADGMRLFSVSDDDTLRCWSIAEATKRRSILRFPSGVWYAAQLDQERFFVMTDGQPLRIVRAVDGAALWQSAMGYRTDCVGTPNGRWIAAREWWLPDAIVVWDLWRLCEVGRLPPEYSNDGLHGLALANDGRRLAVARDGGGAVFSLQRDSRKVYDLGTDPPEFQVAALNQGRLACMADAPNQRLIRIVDFDTGETVHRVAPSTTGHGFAISYDGRLLAEAIGEQILLTDLSSSTPLGSLVGALGRIHVMAFSPDGTTLAATTVSEPGVNMWDLRTRQYVGLMPTAEAKGGTWFSGDGSSLLHGSYAGLLSIWRGVSPTERATAPIAGGPSTPPRSEGSLSFIDRAAADMPVNLVNRQSGKCLDVQGAKGPKSSDLVQQWERTMGRREQQWKLLPTSGGFHLLIPENGSRCLAARKSNQPGVTDFVHLEEFEGEGLPHQQWRIRATVEGYWVFVNRASGECLDVHEPDIAKDGARVLQNGFAGDAKHNQQWTPAEVVPSRSSG